MSSEGFYNMFIALSFSARVLFSRCVSGRVGNRDSCRLCTSIDHTEQTAPLVQPSECSFAMLGRAQRLRT